MHMKSRGLLAAMVAPADTAKGARGRLVVVGSLDFATDRFVHSAPENLAFTLNAVDWLAQDEALIAIRSKDRRPPALMFQSAPEREGAGREDGRVPQRLRDRGAGGLACGYSVRVSARPTSGCA